MSQPNNISGYFKKCSFGHIEIIDDIVFIRYKVGAEVTEQTQEEQTLVLESIGSIDQKYLVVYVVGEDVTVSIGAFKQSNNPRFYKNAKAVAFIPSNMAQKLMANTLINVMKTPVPSKFFLKEEEAIAWLRSI